MVISAKAKMTATVLMLGLSRAIAAKSARDFGEKQGFHASLVTALDAVQRAVLTGLQA